MATNEPQDGSYLLELLARLEAVEQQLDDLHETLLPFDFEGLKQARAEQ